MDLTVNSGIFLNKFIKIEHNNRLIDRMAERVLTCKIINLLCPVSGSAIGYFGGKDNVVIMTLRNPLKM